MSRKIDVLYYSATGNTEAVVTELVNALCMGQCMVRKQSLCETYEHVLGSELLLAFPVNSQAVSPFIWRALKALPEGKGDKAYVVITMNESAAILTPVYKLLVKKGYKPTGCAEISMPNNLLLSANDIDTLNRLSSGLAQAKQFAVQIAINATEWHEAKKGSVLVSLLSRETGLPWLMMRIINKLDVDREKCVKCGKCIDECPVHNIKMAGFPIHLSNCQFCMRCGAMCPKHAIILKNKPECQMRKTKWSECL